ncbi:RecBCD enzyme subunit RecB [invertebrate metagenome]|uniref:DNA 3'-5' helicase n=1 Tax=invertebrate metagenome TaxID=1711999 RepID=A0A2H9T857_9ZZZZ
MRTDTPPLRHGQLLDAATVPLTGTQLIEASAGTGKTYTIANLYLRMLLGHRKDKAKPLTVDQILVVTFTEAATAELRDRIRQRSHETRLAFLENHSNDEFISILLSDIQNHEYAAQLLLNAERQMDEAAIFTIHGFCQRMLKQHAFESGILFSSELVTDETSLQNTCAADFWRRMFYPMETELASLARSLWKSPETLLKNLKNVLHKHDLHIDDGTIPKDIPDFIDHYVTPTKRLKALWKQEFNIIGNELKTCGLMKNRKPFTQLKNMEAFILSDQLIPEGNASWDLYRKESLQKDLKKTGSLPSHSIFSEIDGLPVQSVPLKTAFSGMVIKQALTDIKQQMREIKDMHHQLSFDDLLTNMALALESSNGNQLKTAIQQQFPVALIDEFQDTDPLQYRIFTHIYPLQTTLSKDPDVPPSGLFMIGDPKQAIYAFRGADIFTYIHAKNQVHATYTLGTNWRSGSSMVHAVNHLFEQAGSSFIYDKDIPFFPVNDSGVNADKKLIHHDNPVPAGQIWLQGNPEGSDKIVTKGNYEHCMAQATALKINELMTDADQGDCYIHINGKQRPLEARDIAVLVRTGEQGKLIREVLAQQGIASVYLSNKDSVFKCAEAKDIQRLLAACLSPSHDRTLRAALACSLFNLDAASLDQLNNDEQVWESVMDEFTRYQDIWFRQGVFPMLHTLLFQRDIPQQLLLTPFGERRLTNVMHLGEILASAALEQETPHALLRWYSDQITRADDNNAEQQLHLESELNLVKIITIHKSKGLEYNVVFLPFMCGWKQSKSAIYHDTDSHKMTLSLTDSPDEIAQADNERLAEDLRLLYVALTRSVLCCYMGIAPIYSGNSKGTTTQLSKTAVGWLLKEGKDIEAEELPMLLQSIINSDSAFEITAPPSLPIPPYIPPQQADIRLDALEFNGTIEKNWSVTSYSALSRHNHREDTPVANDASREQPGVDMEVISEGLISDKTEMSDINNENQQEKTIVESEKDHSDDEWSVFQFPKGARPGTFLHTLFEHLDFQIQDQATLEQYVLDHLQREGYEEQWMPAITRLLRNTLDAPLDGNKLRMNQLSPQQKKVEMEFFIPVESLNSHSLNRLIQSSDPLSKNAGNLDFWDVKGMLKGFIDLTFEHDGHWYVLDYKSNWLGDSPEDYICDAMKKAMIDHRYDLQYQIYSLALHRLLRQRIPNYDYEQHFGGVFYLFLRGITDNDPIGHGIFNARPDKQLIERLDSLFAGKLPYRAAHRL